MDDMLIERRSSKTRIGRPPGKSGVKTFPKLIGVGLTEEMYDELKVAAESDYRTVAAQVRFFIDEGLSRWRASL